MHMRIAGRTMTGEQVGPHGMVQLYDADGRMFSAPITAGEAGWGRVGSDHTLCTFDENGRWAPRVLEGGKAA